ncbi:MAG: GYD domain-containing protein [Candidatus Acidiferrales bacterium]
MAKYLLEVSYSVDGAKGLLKDGGTKRKQVVEAAIAAGGGKLEAFYFAFGKNDAYLIVDVKDHASVAGVNLVVQASGAATVHTTVLLTPEEIDQASKKNSTYTPPGR